MAYNIKRFTLGAVVKYAGVSASTPTYTYPGWTFGHVKGFSRNGSDEINLIVLGDDQAKHYVHPENVELDFD